MRPPVQAPKKAFYSTKKQKHSWGLGKKIGFRSCSLRVLGGRWVVSASQNVAGGCTVELVRSSTRTTTRPLAMRVAKPASQLERGELLSEARFRRQERGLVLPANRVASSTNRARCVESKTLCFAGWELRVRRIFSYTTRSKVTPTLRDETLSTAGRRQCSRGAAQNPDLKHIRAAVVATDARERAGKRHMNDCGVGAHKVDRLQESRGRGGDAATRSINSR